MLETLVNLIDPQTLTMLLAAVAAGATVLTLAMPLIASDALAKRMRSVAFEREKLRQRERERLARGDKVHLRRSPKQFVQTIVDSFNLTKWVGQEEARLKLVQAGFRGHAPYVTDLFFRMATPAASLPTPQTLDKPDVAASDCVATTFFAQLVGSTWRFCGTSAAAPHAAGSTSSRR